MNQLFCDGGVIGANPSGIGRTWAFKRIHVSDFDAGQAPVVYSESGVITPRKAGMPSITNNLTEMLALLKGLASLDKDWNGTIYSDSQITLGRAFMGWKWKNIPMWMHAEFQRERARLWRWDEIKYVLLDGHPTIAQLAAGIGKRGGPVSEHNVWCDQACTAAGQDYLQRAEQYTVKMGVPA